MGEVGEYSDVGRHADDEHDEDEGREQSPPPNDGVGGHSDGWEHQRGADVEIAAGASESRAEHTDPRDSAQDQEHDDTGHHGAGRGRPPAEPFRVHWSPRQGETDDKQNTKDETDSRQLSERAEHPLNAVPDEPRQLDGADSSVLLRLVSDDCPPHQVDER